MSTPTPLLILAGSTRAQSFNRRLASVAAECARTEGAAVTLLELSDYELPLYNGDLETRGVPEAVVRLKEIFYAHPACIICSPEYNGGLTGVLKNTIDWVSRPIAGDPAWSNGLKPFAGKVVGIMSASPGALGGIRSLAQLDLLMTNLQCWVAPRRFGLSKAGEAFDAQGQLSNEASHKAVQAVVEQTLWAARKFQA